MFDQTISQSTMISTEYISSAKVNAARSGIYICTATIAPNPESEEFINGSNAMMGSAKVTVGKCYIILVLEYRLTFRGNFFNQLSIMLS